MFHMVLALCGERVLSWRLVFLTRLFTVSVFSPGILFAAHYGTGARHFHIYDPHCMSLSETNVCFVEDGISKRIAIKQEEHSFSLLLYENGDLQCEDDLVLEVFYNSHGYYLYSPVHGKIEKIIFSYGAAGSNNGFVEVQYLDGAHTHWRSHQGLWGGFPNEILQALQEWIKAATLHFKMENVVENRSAKPLVASTQHHKREQTVPGSRYNTDAEFRKLRDNMLGQKFTKKFPGHGDFRGNVVQYGIAGDNYIVEYEDGDSETLRYTELVSLINRYKV